MLICLYTLIWLWLFSNVPKRLEASLRLCEVQGTCFKCSNGHFSHFLCRSNVDCYSGEVCLPQRGFCCPGIQTKNENRAEQFCPDGTSWEKMCKKDADCQDDELCTEGKCCSSCRQRRLRALKELRSFGTSTGNGIQPTEATPEQFIPQCSDDGKHFRPMQCTGRSGECFCVDKVGRRHRHQGKKTNGHHQQNCSSLRELEEGEKVSVSPRVALSRDHRHHKESPSPSAAAAAEEEERCTDSLREFRYCGSACPISCATRTMPRCPQEQCLRGCFCRLPYVILDASDPFGSRCVLPAECPLLSFTPEWNQWNGRFFPANQPAPNPPKRTEKCRDPLKNFQSCGSACPVGCGRLVASDLPDCTGHCVPGCFCRIPYVLRDASDPSSECILPQQCAASTQLVPPILSQMPTILSAPSEAELCLPQRNQSWTGCFSRKCSRSCGEWPPFCVPDDCQPGCECQPPAVVKDKAAHIWECILPEECPKPKRKKTQKGEEEAEGEGKELQKCGADPRKEFLKCGSSCPLGCNQLDQPLQQCSPCLSGCFCRNGYIFVNASEWRTSNCVPLAECPKEEGRQPAQPPTIILALPPSATTITAIQRVNIEEGEEEEKPPQPPTATAGMALVPPQCSVNSLDHRDGKLCLNEEDCGIQRTCCSWNGSGSGTTNATTSTTSAMAAVVGHCTCRDPNAIWTDCGPLCPEFCAQTSPHLCPGPCRPGCFCPPGYVKRNRDMESECVPVAECAVNGESIDSDVTGDGIQRIEKEKKACGEALASATLYSRNDEQIGRLMVRPERPTGRQGTTTKIIHLSGEFTTRMVFGGGGGGDIFLSIHQFSDTTINGCAGVGQPLKLHKFGGVDDDSGGGGGGFVEELRAHRQSEPQQQGTFGLNERIEWPDPIGQGTNPLIGHSVVLQQARAGGEYRVMLACAVLGIAPNC